MWTNLHFTAAKIGQNKDKIKFPRCCAYKGAVIDKHFGNVIQLDAVGDVMNVFHGTKELSVHEVQNLYYSDDYMCLVNVSDTRRFNILHTSFEVAFAATLLVVGMHTESEDSIDPSTFPWQCCCSKIIEAFRFVQSGFCTYGFESQVMANLSETVPR
eukprot:CAMPEP_0204888408 /NCGR_PEP_ID=MMETSP1349-20130617/20192_1 /ASSEMBLY_ACC=CAM_ASM_000710 /TAXON_ID=215587 /ORGANISM="Aplanochytrium stocchinoi, Strain GSBS06" /LENGTH=156 /DNA_ID=CAMNT_0052051821 /DNA_START=1 /DNA_END=468 /DNA_ORIENTATION=-